MAITTKLVSSFSTLNDDRSLAMKPNAASREREAVVDVTFASGDNYVTGGVTVDFSKIRKFTRVYAVDVLHTTKGVLCSYIPSATEGASDGKIKIFGNQDPAVTGGAIIAFPELPNASTITNSLVLRTRIRGI